MLAGLLCFPADGAASLEASLQLGSSGEGQGESASDIAELDPFGRAVVACLAQLAVTSGSDAQWKPLNHQVLMLTRSLEPRTRLLALETVAQVRQAAAAAETRQKGPPCCRLPALCRCWIPSRFQTPPACLRSRPSPPLQLVGRLSEEYLALLPETLPFLAELLEDAELAVEARAQRVVRQLEALSGESLEQYLR
jgi:U3 small nucleolar RNA-associated protein 10